MARYRGPKSKKSRAFGMALEGFDRNFDKRKYPPGQHGVSKRRGQKSEYSIQLMEKQKAKYMYGVLERQFRNIFTTALSKEGKTGDNLFKLLEARLDNVVYRLGIGNTRRSARQIVNHRHILVNGTVCNIPSRTLKPGDVVAIRGRSLGLDFIIDVISKKPGSKYAWLEWNPDKKEGIFLNFPERENIPETINEQLIVELYSK